MFFKKLSLPNKENALPGRDVPLQLENVHHVHSRPIQGPFDEGFELAMFGLGCFWGAERKFWLLDGVYTTAVGYAAGFTPNPTYEEVCSGQTGHNEVVLVVYDPGLISYQELLTTFFESHNPTQGMQQGNDRGTQYRSGIYFYNQKQQELAKQIKQAYQRLLSDKMPDLPLITTEIVSVPSFYYAEQYHQQYLSKNPNGYCGLGGTGISCQL